MVASIARVAPGKSAWGPVLVGLVFVLALVSALFADTLRALVSTWMGSETYAHGFLIVPISLWLVWEKRAALRVTVPQPTLLPALLMLPVGLVWLLAQLVDVRVVQEYAFVCLLILAIWAMIGTATARFLAFPLGFLLLAVPVGDGLTYPLMNFTADFSVNMLRLTGIPVYRDGTFFSLPTGDWSVIEECSGIRYLLASVTLGVLFSYLTYSKIWKRVLFIALSALVPILANGLRAYMIVMIGHLSGMKLATGVDHLVYGWVFFGIVIAIMFAVGAIWRDPEPDKAPRQADSGAGRSTIVAALSVLLASAVGPGLLLALERAPAGGDERVELRSPAPVGGWQSEGGNLWSWRPHIVGTDGEVYGFYRAEAAPVGLYLGIYRRQREGAEVVNVQNQMVPTSDLEWSDKEITTRRIASPIGEFKVKQDRLAGRLGGQRLLVWNWYRIGAVNTSNPFVAKFAEAAYRLVGRQPSGAVIVLAAPYRESPDEAAAVLTVFIDAMWPSLEAEIQRATGHGR
ncbi:exosortase A [Candidatus Thiodictyon syntrophicum]|jgi:exosortase A|uniref:Methanolan biosynthesis EpsI domain-containing protein n=1 Tax=Candidatus Thiodictyon syntrophicum TaxID=1166950 RepID=A0A2K8UCE2_9GAMM|nr:exosortase A [Candidatus Thiodictyon syntrophicum]AUB83205.1 hypothetical protein THSYN_21175 [Candidatus Thiodictyon syntrophicum]